MPELPEGVKRWVFLGDRMEKRNPPGATGGFVAISDLPAILAAERERWEAELLRPEAIEAVRTNRDREDEEHKGESRIIYVRGQNIGADLRAALDSTKGEGDA